MSKFEAQTKQLLDKIKNSEKDEKKELENKYKTLTEQLKKVYSVLNS